MEKGTRFYYNNVPLFYNKKLYVFRYFLKIFPKDCHADMIFTFSLLMSPAMVAAAALTGKVSDARDVFSLNYPLCGARARI